MITTETVIENIFYFNKELIEKKLTIILNQNWANSNKHVSLMASLIKVFLSIS